MENIDRFEQLLREHSYQSLSTDQREWIAPYISSEEEYESLRRSSLQLDEHFASGGARNPSPEILQSLKSTWAQSRQPVSKGILGWSVPGYAFVIGLLVAGTASWFGALSRTPATRYVDRAITRYDTVLVASKPDTVVIERVVYRQVPAPNPALTIKNVNPEKPGLGKGVNMKEKEELEKLLVSGGF